MEYLCYLTKTVLELFVYVYPNACPEWATLNPRSIVIILDLAFNFCAGLENMGEKSFVL